MSCIPVSREDWEVVHQRVQLQVEPRAQHLAARTELLVLPHDSLRIHDTKHKRTNPLTHTIRLNAAHNIRVKAVAVNGIHAKHSSCYYSRSEQGDKSIAQYEHDLDKQMDLADEGELVIEVPGQVMEHVADQLLVHALSVSMEEQEGEGDASRVAALKCPVLVAIEYAISEHAEGGVKFVSLASSNNNSYLRFPHCFTVAKEGNVATWMPCRDSHWERFTAEIEIICPSSCTAICSGENYETGFVDNSKAKKVFKFRLDVPTTAANIGWVVGEFEFVNLPTSDSLNKSTNFNAYFITQANTGATYHVGVSKPNVLHSCSCVYDIAQIYEEYIGTKCPFQQFNLVFVECVLPRKALAYGNLVLLETSLVHSDTIIEQTYETRMILAYCIAKSWVLCSLFHKAIADFWILEGISGFLCQLFVKKCFGKNESIYQRNLAIKKVVALSSRQESYPLFTEEFGHPSEIYLSEHFILKSYVVVHMLADKVSEESFREIIQQAFKEAGPDASKVISTKRFLKWLRHKSALNLDDFRERWIDGKDCPSFEIEARFARKRIACVLNIKQSKKSAIMGRLQVYVHETDRQVYEHEAKLENLSHECDFPCHQKVRKNRKKLVKQDATMDDANPTSETADPAQAQSLAGFNPYDESTITIKNDTPIRWVRIDPKQEWICKIEFTQTPLWLILELEHSHELIPQLESVQGIGKLLNGRYALGEELSTWGETNASMLGGGDLIGKKEAEIAIRTVSVKALRDCIENSEYFFRVRQLCCEELVGASLFEQTTLVGGVSVPFVTTTSEGIGTKTMEILLNYFKKKFYDSQSKLIQPNDFANFSEYFLQKCIPESLSKVRDQRNYTPSKVVEFILDLLKFNDNFENYYSDAFYLANLLESLGNLRPPTQDFVDQIWKQIFRFLNYDKVFPSFNNLLTQACLSAVSLLVSEFLPSTQVLESSIESKDDTNIIESEDELDEDSMHVQMDSKLADDYKSERISLEPSVHPVNFVAYVNDENFSEHMRSHAFGCIVTLSKKIPSLFKTLLDLLEKHIANASLRSSFANIWAEKLLESGIGSSSPVAVYRSQDLEFSKLRSRVYDLLCSEVALMDMKFRFSVFKLYQSIWGYHEKPSITDSASFNSKRRAKYRVEMKSKRDLKKRKTNDRKQEMQGSELGKTESALTGTGEGATENGENTINEI
jgi:hypothetical protein